MNTASLRLLSIVLFLAIGLHLSAEQKKLIHDSDQVSSNYEGSYPDNISNIADEIANTRYYTGSSSTFSESPYIQVSLREPISCLEDEDMVVYVQRYDYDGWTGINPTAFKVQAVFRDENKLATPPDDGDWKDICYIYLLYRGLGTDEYSSRISLSRIWKESGSGNREKIAYLRFTVTANDGKKHTNGFREMAMSEFQIYTLGKEDKYPGIWEDRLHLKTDYQRDFHDFKFINTPGIGTPLNQPEGWQLPDTDVLNGTGILFPDFSFMESDSEDLPYPLGNGQKRQRTHTVEHILYALPGDVVALYPFYELPEKVQYEENFSHWYDWETGGRVKYTTDWSNKIYDLLDFLVDPSEIQITDNYGFFGGKSLPGKQFSISTPEEYIAVVSMVNDGIRNCYIEITADLDFSGYDVPVICPDNRGDFVGIFNGGGKVISNMHIQSTGNDVGMFGHVGNGARIMNLVLDSSCDIVGNMSVGIIGLIGNGEVSISNISTAAKVRATSPDSEHKAGGLIGTTVDNDNKITIDACFIGGEIGNPDFGSNNAAIIGWAGIEGNGGYLRITNTYVNAAIHNFEGGRYYYRSNNDADRVTVADSHGNAPESGRQKFGEWQEPTWTSTGEEPAYIPEIRILTDAEKREKMNRKTGTFATFFCPRNPYEEDGKQHTLPFPAGKDEFVIAADFSQKFNFDWNGTGHVDFEKKTIYEPVIAFRHIFRIRDGKTFAEEFSGSRENNENYVRKNMRIVSARTGIPFQVRFDSPVPKSGRTRSKYYYKISDQDYRRVCGMEIKVLDADTREEIKDAGFYMGDPFTGQGVRLVEGTKYSLCAGEDEYFRMLKCDHPVQGRYIVQLIGKDINENVINVYQSQEPLVVMEYQITFLPDNAASMVTEQTLYAKDSRYKHAREEELEKMYGQAKVRIDFDEYMALENLAAKDDFLKGDADGHYFYKWPVAWNSSNYGFGYDSRYDYDMYQIANHSSQVIYKDAASVFDSNANEKDGKGLYDRLYYKTLRRHKENPALYPESTIQKGYFYYVNAASDPGVMARLNIDELCPGSTIHVSGWLSEFTDKQPETANLAFNFVAVLKKDLTYVSAEGGGEGSSSDNRAYPILKGGDRVVLHTFVSGYVPKPAGDSSVKDVNNSDDLRGEWLNIYYSFVPQLSEFSKEGITSDMVDHYELELDNNCKSSAGADYAIDNIRVYLVKPVVYARQMTPVCDEEQHTTVRIEAPFDVLLQAMGEQEVVAGDSDEEINIYYTFLDKEKYDNSVNERQGKFDDAVLRYDYDNSGAGNEQTFGKLTFKLKYLDNPEYKEREDGEFDLNRAFREISEDDVRMIVFNTEPTDEQLSTGKEYYIFLETATSAAADKKPESGKEYEFFDPESDCVKKCVFKVKSSSVVKVDGVVVEELDNISVCFNQSPVVQVNIWGINNDGEFEEVEKNAFFDWFDGSHADFDDFMKNGVSLKVALELFRKYYPEAESVTGIEAKEDLNQEMLDLIEELSSGNDRPGANPKLMLHQASYVFPPENVEDGKERYCSVLAVPIVKEKDGILICAAPTELRIKVESMAPELLHGLKLDYPEALSDVPLRIGLSQLRSVSGSREETGNVLTIPIRKVAAVGDNNRATGMRPNGADIVLVQTNDPAYRNLGTVDSNGNETGELLTVGEITSFSANLDEDASDNYFSALFLPSFKFKEGYYYRLRFLFEEDNPDDSGQTPDDDSPVCDGQDVFTIKVVPEFQVWTGARNSNFNNDENWNRVSSGLIYKTQDDDSEFMTDGANSHQFSYAPLDFTKIVIPDAERLPYLYEPQTERQDGYRNLPAYNPEVMWASDPSVFQQEGYADLPDDGVGEASYLIQYDMAAYNPVGRDGILCRPWYHNTCAEIHFKPGSELMNQQALRYQKAWVDLQTRPGRWYTLSIPLQEVYAGDMYLPSANARQETELFRPITFDTENYNRFKPAVYQRGWNKGTATVYELPANDGGSGASRDVAVKVTWSHVYNDVKEIFGGGTGYSIKTDVSGMDAHEETVLFRLPKADTSYSYFNQEGDISGNTTSIDRSEKHYKLNPANGEIKSAGAAGSKYFLVGNPFMAHLDMQKFLEANSEVISQKYWILTENGQQAGIFDITDGFTGSASGIVAPMQGFFVEAKDGSGNTLSDESGNLMQELILRYDETMMRRNGDGSDGNPRIGTRSSGKGNFLTISSLNDGEVSSTAVISVNSRFGSGYMENEDMVTLDNSEMDVASTVYTVAAGMALSVNRTDNAEGVEIGVISADDEHTVLRFDGIEAVDGLALFDKASGELTSLYDGMEYCVKGAASHRLYLTGMSSESVSTPIEWSVSGNLVTVYASSGAKTTTVNVFDSLGRRVLSRSDNSDVICFSLESGVYILEVASGNNRLNDKIRI